MVIGLVFFTFWQGMLFTVFTMMGIIHENSKKTWSADAVQAGLEDFVICIEMFFFAIAHAYVFGYSEYLDKMWARDRRASGALAFTDAGVPVAERTIWQNTKDFLRMDDVVEDTKVIAITCILKRPLSPTLTLNLGLTPTLTLS